jgi:DNA modification methylase
MNMHQLKIFSPIGQDRGIVDEIADFDDFGRKTEVFFNDGIRYFVNEFWTARQRQSNNLHEISYRACFKAELPRFFIERLSAFGDLVYDPFMGRGTTLLEANLLGRAVAGNDINPLSRRLIEPRLNPPTLRSVEKRLAEIRLVRPAEDTSRELLAFYHPDTLSEIISLKNWLLDRENGGRLDDTDKWIRMVAVNRLTGHSSGFFSVYSLPPNQAVSVDSQRKINERRNQTPDYRDVKAIIRKKSKNLLSAGGRNSIADPLLLTGNGNSTPQLTDSSVALIVTSPPFLDIVDYQQDNWLRCWFCGIDTQAIKIDRHKTVGDWERFVRASFGEFARVVKSGGHIAFEVGEVRNGTVLLETHVAKAVSGLPFEFLGVMVNDQEFTKTANCWGVGNNKGGTNTNRICLFKRI